MNAWARDPAELGFGFEEVEAPREGARTPRRAPHDADRHRHGKIAAIMAWGAEVEDNTKKPLAKTTDAPTNVRARTFEGAVTLRCNADPRAVGYWFQIGTDPMHPETWPTPIFENGVAHAMPDQVVGTTIFYRMAVQRRRTGRGEWSDIMSVLVK